MAKHDSIKHTLTVAVLLCLACSIVVSTAAVTLKPVQMVNKQLDKQSKILALVDLLDKNQDIQTQFERYVEAKVIDLKTGTIVDDMNASDLDQRKLARDPASSIELSIDDDIANIKRRAQYATVYLIKKNNKLAYLVLPVHGYGLWSTMYGFVALQSDLNTVYGISFYEHAETPGLGGEIDNPDWQAIWRGKKVFGADKITDPKLTVIKGTLDPASPGAEHKIDGIAGATLTARGVGNMIQFWFGKNGYQPFIQKLKNKG